MNDRFERPLPSIMQPISMYPNEMPRWRYKNLISNHFSLWESFDLLEKPACSEPWSLGWFCKTERHSKRTNAPKSPPFPLPHHPTLGPRKNYCNNHQERKIWWLPEQVSLFSSFPRWTAKSSHVFECVGFEMIYRLDFLLLVSIISHLGSEKNWSLIFEEQIGKSALRELYWEREAASPGTKVNYVE